MATAETESIESESDYSNTPEGWAQRWAVEIGHAQKELKKFRKEGKRVVKEYRDSRRGDNDNDNDRRLNLFRANIRRKTQVVYGKSPSVDVSRSFDDSQDEVARVAAEMLERLLNTDLRRKSDTLAECVKMAYQDYKLPGLGMIRLRYEMDEEESEGTPAIKGEDGEERAPAVPGAIVKSREDVASDYFYWEEMLWSPCRGWHDLRWWAFETRLTRDEASKKFGKKAADKLDYKNSTVDRNPSESEKSKPPMDPWQRATVHEIWDKEHRCCWWWSEGASEMLCPTGQECNEDGSLPDPLELEGFWPFARPMMSNLVNEKFVPKADWYFAKDLLKEIDELTTRINLLSSALRVVGIYDQRESALARLVNEADENDMIAVDNWASFAEKGGLKGVVEFLPIDMISAVLEKLTLKRQESIQLYEKVEGTADIMSGEESNPNESATASRVKSRSSSVGIQSDQEELARFVTETMQVRGEIICRHFDDETILDRSNMKYTPDAQLASQAIALLRERFSSYRIQVQSEALAMTNFDEVKNERTQLIEGVAKYATSVGPLVQQMPTVAPLMLHILKHVIAGFKGTSIIEGEVDRAIDQATEALQKAAQNPQATPPNPQLQAEQAKQQTLQMKAQIDAQTAQQTAQLKIQESRQQQAIEAQAKDQERQQDYKYDMMSLQAKQQATEQDLALKARMQEQERAQQQAVEQENHARGLEAGQQAHEQGLEQSQLAHQQAIQQMRAKPALPKVRR